MMRSSVHTGLDRLRNQQLISTAVLANYKDVSMFVEKVDFLTPVIC